MGKYQGFGSEESLACVFMRQKEARGAGAE